MRTRRTKIVATIGPATRNPRIVRRLVREVDVFRINFSHGDPLSHLEEIRTIRAEARSAGRMVAILQDLPGPKVRVGRMKNGSADLVKGSSFVLTPSSVEGNEHIATVNYPELLLSLKKGDLLHLADGLIRLRVEGSLEEGVRCTVLNGGVLASGKGVNAPGVRLKLKVPTPNDVEHIRFGVREGVDFVALSFVRSAADVRGARRFVGRGAFLVVKVEQKEAVRKFREVLDEADGVMVARGDLGINVPIETVPRIQKEIIAACNRVGKPVIVATQMLVSMVNFPVPTRAEVTDVSTAILDGADAVMLSDETAVGKFPVESVQMLDRISRSTEASLRSAPQPPEAVRREDTAESIGRAACRLADYVNAKAIVAPTQTGSTARRVAMHRPRQPIVALCTESRVARRMMLYRGVIPLVSRRAKTVDWLFERADSAAKELGLAKKGERIVVTSGTPGMKGTTNLIKVSVVGSRA
ncbi:MAG: pyruvate kinase [Thaumarchaeota archaeon]|nr:pyruvate kinase [Nitrososphaerota archaeon]